MFQTTNQIYINGLNGPKSFDSSLAVEAQLQAKGLASDLASNGRHWTLWDHLLMIMGLYGIIWDYMGLQRRNQACPDVQWGMDWLVGETT